jgi:hypothetical protein
MVSRRSLSFASWPRSTKWRSLFSANRERQPDTSISYDCISGNLPPVRRGSIAIRTDAAGQAGRLPVRARAAQRPRIVPVHFPGPAAAPAGAGRWEPMAQRDGQGLGHSPDTTEKPSPGRAVRPDLQDSNLQGTAQPRVSRHRHSPGAGGLHAVGDAAATVDYYSATEVAEHGSETPGAVEHHSGNDRERWSRAARQNERARRPQRSST